jgi:competence protein ComEA
MATSEELQQVPGIGPATAEKILQMRKSYGPFKSVDDLLAIRGLGPKRLEKMRKYLTVGNVPLVAPQHRSPAPQKQDPPAFKKSPTSPKTPSKTPADPSPTDQVEQPFQRIEISCLSLFTE